MHKYENMKKEFLLDQEELYILAEYIIKTLPKGGIIALQGNLSSGKTTLVKAFCKYFDLEATSPTFSIMNVYGNNIYHYDIYSKGLNHFLSQGLLENLQEDGWHFVEWAEEDFKKLLNDFGFYFISIKITPDKSKRRYEIDA